MFCSLTYPQKTHYYGWQTMTESIKLHEQAVFDDEHLIHMFFHVSYFPRLSTENSVNAPGNFFSCCFIFFRP